MGITSVGSLVWVCDINVGRLGQGGPLAYARGSVAAEFHIYVARPKSAASRSAARGRVHADRFRSRVKRRAVIERYRGYAGRLGA